MRKEKHPHPTMQAEIDSANAIMALEGNEITPSYIVSSYRARLANLILVSNTRFNSRYAYYISISSLTTVDVEWLLIKYKHTISTSVVYQLVASGLVPLEKIKELILNKRTRCSAAEGAARLRKKLDPECIDMIISWIQEKVNSYKDPYGSRGTALIRLIDNNRLSKDQLDRIAINCMAYTSFLKPLINQPNMTPPMLNTIKDRLHTVTYRRHNERTELILRRMAELSLIMFERKKTRPPFPKRR